MAARNFAPIRCMQRDVVVLYAGGTGAGAGDLTGVVGKAGLKQSGSDQFNQTGTGLYQVTLADKYHDLLFFSGLVLDATDPDDWEVVVVSEDVAGAKTIDLAVFKGGALTDLTTDEKLRCQIVLKNGNQGPS